MTLGRKKKERGRGKGLTFPSWPLQGKPDRKGGRERRLSPTSTSTPLTSRDEKEGKGSRLCWTTEGGKRRRKYCLSFIPSFSSSRDQGKISKSIDGGEGGEGVESGKGDRGAYFLFFFVYSVHECGKKGKGEE